MFAFGLEARDGGVLVVDDVVDQFGNLLFYILAFGDFFYFGLVLARVDPVLADWAVRCPGVREEVILAGPEDCLGVVYAFVVLDEAFTHIVLLHLDYLVDLHQLLHLLL